MHTILDSLILVNSLILLAAVKSFISLIISWYSLLLNTLIKIVCNCFVNALLTLPDKIYSNKPKAQILIKNNLSEVCKFKKLSFFILKTCHTVFYFSVSFGDSSSLSFP